jgi:hypothetical protein
LFISVPGPGDLLKRINRPVAALDPGRCSQGFIPYLTTLQQNPYSRLSLATTAPSQTAGANSGPAADCHALLFLVTSNLIACQQYLFGDWGKRAFFSCPDGGIKSLAANFYN